jgi:hypothetical protein
MTSDAPFLHTDRDQAALAFGADPSDVDPSPLTTIHTHALTPVYHMHATPTLVEIRQGQPTGPTRTARYCWVQRRRLHLHLHHTVSASRYTCLLAYALYTRALGAGALTRHSELTRMQYQYRPTLMCKT